MADRVADHVGALVRCLSLHLNGKVTGVIAVLLNHQGAGSLGAIAGFAIAFLFAWRFLRPSPGRRASDRRKRGAAPSTSRLAGGLEPSGSRGLVPTGPSNDTVAVEAITCPAELSLGQTVKQRLGGCGKITCQLLGVILEEKTPEELQKHATVRLSVLQIVEEISKYFDLFLMETVLDDESEEKVLSALENAGIFQNGSLIKDKERYKKILGLGIVGGVQDEWINSRFHISLHNSTDIGRKSFVRQLEADWHIDTNLEIISQLSQFIRFQLYISEIDSGQIPRNVSTSTSLERFFS